MGCKISLDLLTLTQLDIHCLLYVYTECYHVFTSLFYCLVNFCLFFWLLIWKLNRWDLLTLVLIMFAAEKHRSDAFYNEGDGFDRQRRRSYTSWSHIQWGTAKCLCLTTIESRLLLYCKKNSFCFCLLVDSSRSFVMMSVPSNWRQRAVPLCQEFIVEWRKDEARPLAWVKAVGFFHCFDWITGRKDICATYSETFSFATSGGRNEMRSLPIQAYLENDQ